MWEELLSVISDSLNAPYGARCFLTWMIQRLEELSYKRLNAPYGARCFLTDQDL